MKPVLFENWNSKKNDFVVETLDLSDEPEIFEFLERGKLNTFYSKVAKIELSDRKCGYSVIVDKKYKSHKQWTYILVINGKVVKCGDSTMTLSGRWNSYSAGTRENRERGTCSTTNYFISEIIRESLDMGYEVELYGYPIPNQYIEIEVHGNSINAVCDFVSYFESDLINKFNNIYGKKPIVGKNGLVKI